MYSLLNNFFKWHLNVFHFYLYFYPRIFNNKKYLIPIIRYKYLLTQTHLQNFPFIPIEITEIQLMIISNDRDFVREFTY